MCTNGVFGLFGDGYMMNPYLPMAGFLTSTLGHCPGNIWSARNWTQMANVYTHSAAYPYGFYFNFSGRPQYVVADAFHMPYQTALGLQTGGLYSSAPSPYELQLTFAAMNKQAGVRIDAGTAGSNLQKVKSVAACKEQDFMKSDENKDLRDEVIALEKKADELLKQLEETMKDFQQGKLSTEEADAKVAVIAGKAKEFVGESDELYKRIDEAYKAYTEKKTAEAAAVAEEAASGTDDGTSGSADVADVEGDKTLTNEECKKEYGIEKDATIGECADADSLASQALAAVGKWDDDDNKKEFDALFGTGAATDTNKINPANIVEVLDAVDMTKLIKGVEEQDSGDNNTSLARIVTLLNQRLVGLKDAGHISTEDYNKVKATLKEISDSNKSSFPDISTTVGKLKAVCDILKGKGTKVEVEKNIKDAQNKRVEEAKNKFRADYAKKEEKTVEAGKNYKFPEEVTYLPNKKIFRVKIEGKTFQGKDLAELNSKILKSADENIITSWKEIKAECLEAQA